MYAIDKEIKETIDSLNSNMGYPTDNSGIILERYLEPVIDSTNLVEKDKAYHIKIRTEKPGVASIATTSKISNLRFRLKDLILEGIPKTFATFKAILGSDTNTLLLGITILNFLKFIADKSTITIQKEDAAVLCWLYLAYQEEKIVGIDTLLAITREEMSSENLHISLATLEKLGCITLLSDEIILNEDIVFESK